MCLISLYSNWIISEKISSGYDIITHYIGSNFFKKPSKYIYDSLEEISFYAEIISMLNSETKTENDSYYIVNTDNKEKIDSIFEFFKLYFLDIKNLSFNQEMKFCLFKKNKIIKSTDSRIESKNVLKYLDQNNGFNNDLIKEINDCNEKIYHYFLTICNKKDKNDDFILDENEISYMKNLKDENLKLIRCFQKLSVLSNVDIIPNDSIEFILKILALKSCCFCVIPGAGGYDAIISLFVNQNKFQEENEYYSNINKICKEFNYDFLLSKLEKNKEYSIEIL